MSTAEFQQTFLPWFEAGAAALDLSSTAQRRSIATLAEEILGYEPSPDGLALLERELSGDAAKEKVPGVVHLALKVARSRALIAGMEEPTRVSVVIAAFGEHERLLKIDEHTAAQDFLRRNVEAMCWLFDTHTNFSWEILLVDDGCPHGSGRIAQEIVDTEGFGACVRVLHLADAIARGERVTEPMSDTSESQLGGAVAYGMAEAVAEPHPNHVVVVADASLATHLGQVGLLVDAIVDGGADAVVGSRYESTSVAVQEPDQTARDKLFLYLWKRLFQILPRTNDMQCGLAAFRASCVDELTAATIEKGSGFGAELLLRTELGRPNAIESVALLRAESGLRQCTAGVDARLAMLQGMVAIYRVYLHPSEEADAFAALIEQLKDASWERLTQAIPSAIAEREPGGLASWNGVSAAELQAAIDASH